MGICSSAIANTNENATIDATRQRQRQHDLWMDGILVPPMFGIPATGTFCPSIIVNANPDATATTTKYHTPILGYVDYLRTQTDLSYRLLHTHLHPGVWISSNSVNRSDSNSASSKTNVRVGVFDNTATSTSLDDGLSKNHPKNNMQNYGFGTSSSSSSLDDDATNNFSISSKTIQQPSDVGGQVTLERQFINNKTGRNYGAIYFHTDPMNPQFAYKIHMTHRPIPSLSLFGMFLSSSSSQSSKPVSPNGYIGAQINQTIPLSSSRYSKPMYDDNIDGTSPYIIPATTQNHDESAMNCKVGVYLPINWNLVLDTLQTKLHNPSKKRFSSKDAHLVPFYHNKSTRKNEVEQDSWTSKLLSTTTNEVNGCASVSVLGATAAVQGTMPLSLLLSADGRTRSPADNVYRTSSYFTTNINDESTNQSSPIQLTIQQQNQFGRHTITTSSSISVSQIITFQRYQFNMFEAYRAPYIHNTLAWTIQMESLSKSSSSSPGITQAEDSGEHTATAVHMHRMNSASLGAVWQLNRNVALKAVLYPQSSSFHNDEQRHQQRPLSNNNINATTAILLKRWYYPRITCSILHKWDPMPRFAGIGIDIETGDDNSSTATTIRNNDCVDANEDDDDMSFTQKPPPTIAVLPKELYKLKRQH